MREMRRAALLIAICLAAAAGSAAAAPSAAPIKVSLTAQSHHPVVGKTWWYQVKVTDAAGKPVAAKIHVQILFGGQPVGQVGTHKVKTGLWREVIGKGGVDAFPAAARGQPLVFQAVVTEKGVTVKRNWPIVVR